MKEYLNYGLDYYNNLGSIGVIAFYIACLLILLAIILFVILLIKEKKVTKKEFSIVASNNLPMKTTEENLTINNIEELKYNDLTDELIDRNLSNTTKIDIDNITKQIASDLEDKNINFTDFEKDQEEKAIISYEELKKAATDKELPNLIKYKIDAEENYVENMKKFRQSPLISPVYGVKKEQQRSMAYITDKEEITELEKTLDIKPINKEIKKSDEFLKVLKDFRNNLE
jgi:hypothetical protein